MALYSDALRVVSANMSTVATLTDSLHTENYDGWAAISETFTYASATTITVPTGAASRYQIGDKLRLTNSTLKYGYITIVADTLLTWNGGTDYALANAAISGVSLSRADRPFGFPAYFNYTPTFTGFSANPASGLYTFFIKHGWVSLNWRQPNSGTSDATGFTGTLPVTAKTVANQAWGQLCLETFDNSANQTAPGNATVLSAGTIVTISKTVGGGAFTASGGKRASFTNLLYQLA